MKKSNLFLILPFTFLVIGCQLKGYIQNKLKVNNENNNLLQKQVTKTETNEISISCNKETIQDYIDNGWKVVSSSTTDVPCSWKTIKARKGCNLERDKGCKITVPDKIGEKTTYILEKETTVEADLKNITELVDETKSTLEN